MSNILLTGMTSPQASAGLGVRSLSFARLLQLALIDQGHQVTWSQSSVDWDQEHLSQFDLVLIGVAPVTSLSANYAYGALSLIDQLWNDTRLRLFIDAPDASQIRTSLQTVVLNEKSLYKSFYKSRREYEKVTASARYQAVILTACTRLLRDEWPTTLYPGLPWKDHTEALERALPEGATGSLRAVNLDSLVLAESPSTAVPTGERWLVDSEKSPWTKSVKSTLLLPTAPVKWHKGWTDEQVRRQMRSAVGVLVAPQKQGGTWWSPYYLQALSQLVPVASEWQDTAELGAQWNVLAASIESMSSADRAVLAASQRALYLERVPSQQQAPVELARVLKIENGETHK